MPSRSVFAFFRNSITLKISLVIFIIEAMLLFVMGFFYINNFHLEIQERLTEKLIIPGRLMSQMALNFDAVHDFSSLEEIIAEDVTEAFVLKKDGTVFFSSDPLKVGEKYSDFLASEETLEISEAAVNDRIIQFKSDDGEDFLSIMSPLLIKDNLLGFLYIKIRASQITARKREIVLIFLIGSVLTLFLTTVAEAFWVHHLFVPRIRRTVSTLREVGEGKFSSRIDAIGSPDQIGSLMLHANEMIEQIDIYTKNLQALTQAGEDLSYAESQSDICAIVSDLLGKRYGAEAEGLISSAPGGGLQLLADCREFNNLGPLEQKLILNGEILLASTASGTLDPPSQKVGNNNNVHLFVPVRKGRTVKEIICFSIDPGEVRKKEDNDIFLRTLSRLMVNADRRVEALAELRTAEREYRELFTNAVEGIFRSTLEGQIEAANPSLAIMFGYESPEDMIGSVTNLATQAYSDPADRSEVLRRIKEDGRVVDMNLLARRKDGSTFWASMSAHAIWNRDGKLTGIEGGMVDISERLMKEEADSRRKTAEAADQAKSELLSILEAKNSELEKTLEKLQVAQAKLIQSEKMAAIGTMAGGVAHDINNILSGIVGYPDLLLMQLPEESDLRSGLEVIKDSGARAAAVVADLLTLARGVAYNTVIFDINNLVEKYRESPEFKQLEIRYPEIQVTFQADPDLRHTECSPIHIQKVLTNLVMNAVEAVHGKGSVAVSTGNRTIKDGDEIAATLETGDYVMLKVSDSGPGISAEDLDHVFEPFYTKKILGRSGTGLGLAVVWNTIQEHRGTVTAESDHTGAAFTVYLPASREKGAEKEGSSLSLEELKGSGSILVVDDELLLRNIASMMLTTLGYTVEAVSSGEEALDYLKNRSVDLVLLDMLMPPGMNGYQTYREIVKIHPRQKAVICSGFAKNENLAKAQELGAGGFLKKPFTLEQLAGIVKQELEKTS